MLKHLISRFNQMSHIYVGSDIPTYRMMFYYLDFLLAFVFYGSSISDYFAYGFYKQRRAGRNEYITYRRYHKIQNICNPVDKHREICRNKINFNHRFSNFLGRNWLDVSKSDFSQFEDFVNRHDIIFIKEVNGFRGIGTTKYITKDILDINELYNILQSDDKSHYIIEEQITQIASLKEFHPWSVNTIRIVTVYNDKTNQVHFMNARFRMGNKRNHVDNFHFDGIGANINIKTGIIDTLGYDAYNNTYIFHPETHKQIIGFKIPYWEECKDFAARAAKSLPEIRYVGWDIVIKDGGEFILIEANDNADHDFQQLHNKGLWKEYRHLISQLK